MDASERRRRIRAWLGARPRSAAPVAAHRSLELRAISPPDIDSIAFRRRSLPHWEFHGSTYFITFRVARARGRPFAAEDAWSSPAGPGAVVEEVIIFGVGSRYELEAYVVMPDHVHLLLTPTTGPPLPRILHEVKGYSAWRLNRVSGTKGALWQDESFDHLIRGEADWLDKWRYIVGNPVAAGLASGPGAYPLSSAVTLDPPGRREGLRRLLNDEPSDAR